MCQTGISDYTVADLFAHARVKKLAWLKLGGETGTWLLLIISSVINVLHDLQGRNKKLQETCQGPSTHPQQSISSSTRTRWIAAGPKIEVRNFVSGTHNCHSMNFLLYEDMFALANIHPSLAKQLFCLAEIEF